MSWQGLQESALYKHLNRTMATSMGHLDQERQGLQSTKTSKNHLPQPLSSDILDDFFPSTNIKKTHDCVASLFPFNVTNKGYMDLTGRFPHKSSRGNEYLLIVYD